MQVLKDEILNCIDTIGKCMANNRLRLNPSNSAFVWCATPRWVHLIDRSAFRLKDWTVKISSIINVHVWPYQQTHHDTCFRQLCPLKCIWRSPTLIAIQLANSWVDYYNSILAGLPKYQQDWFSVHDQARVQSVDCFGPRLLIRIYINALTAK